VRVVVDTSVWIDYLRGRSARVRELLDELIDDDRVALAIPVRIELLGGAGRQGAARLARILDAIPTYHPVPATWATMERWAIDAASRGSSFGVGDLLIGAIAERGGMEVWSLDEDFDRMAEMGYVRTFRPDRSSK